MNKGSLDEKRKELKALEDAAQREHAEHALALAKLAFPDTPFVHAISTISVVTFEHYDWIMHNSLQGGNSDQGTLFTISSETGDWKLHVDFCQADLNRLRNHPLQFTDGKKSPKPVVCPFHVLKYTAMHVPSQLLEPQKATEARELYVRRVAEWWAHLEVFILIYLDQMKTCPVLTERPINGDTFMKHFVNAMREL